MFDDFEEGLARVKFKQLLQELSELLHRRQWKWKLVVFNDAGDEWELAPNVLSFGPGFTSKQTKRRSARIECEVSDERPIRGVEPEG